MSWQDFQGLVLPHSQHRLIKRRYSVTSDVLSFQHCGRQYGHFAVRGYEPAHTVQIYYGTIIHQVLDRAHAHYSGLRDSRTKGQIPTDQDIRHYFGEVDAALKARGIRSVRPFRQDSEREAALRRLVLFNKIEGPELYPRVRDTEHRLQSDRGDYLLHGTVDVIANAPNWLPGMKAEIWDYKGGPRPNRNSQDYHRYEFQMLVYAELYRERNGEYPERAILYYLGELDEAADSRARPDQALIEIPLKSRRIQIALETFQNTVDEIENCRLHDAWPTPQPGRQPDERTCDICDLRWNCTARTGKYPMRYP